VREDKVTGLKARLRLRRVIFEGRHERALVVFEVERCERSLERQSRIRNQFDRRLRIKCASIPPDILIDVVGSVCERTGRVERLAPTVEGIRVELIEISEVRKIDEKWCKTPNPVAPSTVERNSVNIPRTLLSSLQSPLFSGHEFSFVWLSG
jgi:hypothetical protein